MDDCISSIFRVFYEMGEQRLIFSTDEELNTFGPLLQAAVPRLIEHIQREIADFPCLCYRLSCDTRSSLQYLLDSYTLFSPPVGIFEEAVAQLALNVDLKAYDDCFRDFQPDLGDQRDFLYKVKHHTPDSHWWWWEHVRSRPLMSEKPNNDPAWMDALKLFIQQIEMQQKEWKRVVERATHPRHYNALEAYSSPVYPRNGLLRS